MYRGAVAVALAGAIAASPVDAQVSDLLSGRHAILDAQAMTLMTYLRCSADVFNAGQKGIMPPVDTSAHLLCAHVRGRLIAAIVKTDSSWKRATSLLAFDARRMERIQEPIDTAEVLVLLRAQRYADWLAFKDSLSGGRGVPVVYRTMDSLIHVWMIPETMIRPSSPAVGGERHYLFPADAKKELSADPVPPVRPAINVNGEWILRSAGDSIPTFSEILLANMLAEDKLSVTIELPRHFLKLATGSGIGMWVWIRKP